MRAVRLGRGVRAREAGLRRVAGEVRSMVGYVQVSPLVAEALHYVVRGWPVLPRYPGGKEPLTGHGVKDADERGHGIPAAAKAP